ncbi:unnamed protein product [Rhizopus stolonifer]
MNKVETLLSDYKRMEITQNEESRRLMKMLDGISKKMVLKTNVKEMTEDTFMINILGPILYTYLDSTMDLLVHHGNDYDCPKSKERKTKQAILHNYLELNIHGRKSDRSGGVIIRQNHKHILYVCEVKTEAECNGRPDPVKIGSLMKDALDSALMCGCFRTEYFTVGLLCEGRMVTVYVLDLAFDGAYRMIEVDYFFLPMNLRDLKTLSTIIEPLLNCRALLEKNKRLILSSHGSPVIDLGSLRHTCKSPARYSDLYYA